MFVGREMDLENVVQLDEGVLFRYREEWELCYL